MRMRNIKLLVEYDGACYVGWQRQLNGKSIQGEIEKALQTILGQDVALIGAGRTDSGVHARGQVANFKTDAALGFKKIRSGLNGLLPEDIVVHSVEEVDENFNARFSAKGREYSYLITQVPTALLRNYSWYVKYPLKENLMNEAAGILEGVHDFTSFARANSDVDHHRCSVILSSWSTENSTLRYTIRADRFLHGMVRALVGTMVDIGRGYTKLEDLNQILESKDRKTAGRAAPACGLILEKVIY